MSFNDYEKQQYAVDFSLSISGRGAKTGHENTEINEAAAIYGNIDKAEQYGYLQRGLKARHIQFIALGGTIGTGLFLGIGNAFARSGPLSVLLGYAITGGAIFCMMQCLGEMATWLPLPGALPQYCSRYVDPALGFAVGWNNWYQCAILLCTEISAAAVLVSFWDHDEKINHAIWITLIIVIIVCLNIVTVAIYGEAEFIFASIKMITILGLLIVGLVIMLGEGAMKEYVGTGAVGRFAGLFSTLVNAAFSYGGVEIVVAAAGEAADPRENIPKAVRRVFSRIFFFYVLGSFIIGVTVSSKDHMLTDKNAKGAQSSPWVIAISNASIPVLPHIINAVILISAASSGNAFLYTGSRYLFGLAQSKQAPQFLLKCSKKGVPYYCVAITASFSLMTYMSMSKGANSVFHWFLNLTTIAQLITWCSICYTYTRFRKALVAQNIDRDTLVFKGVWQPYTAWAAFVYFALILFLNGFQVFTKEYWSSEELTALLTAYIGIPIFFFLFVFWKFFKKTRMVSPEIADIFSGKAHIDEEVWPEQIPRNFMERFWSWIC